MYLTTWKYPLKNLAEYGVKSYAACMANKIAILNEQYSSMLMPSKPNGKQYQC